MSQAGESIRARIEAELHSLRFQWETAHDLARIQDELMLPESVRERLPDLEARRGTDAGP
jgi:hypothetical protein